MTDRNGITTRDNIHLSQGIQARPEPLSEAVSNSLSALGCTDPKILEFVAAATAENTQRAYQSDLRHFLASGGLLPATPEQVARNAQSHTGRFLARVLNGNGQARGANGQAKRPPNRASKPNGGSATITNEGKTTPADP